MSGADRRKAICCQGCCLPSPIRTASIGRRRSANVIREDETTVTADHRANTASGGIGDRVAILGYNHKGIALGRSSGSRSIFQHTNPVRLTV